MAKVHTYQREIVPVNTRGQMKRRKSRAAKRRMAKLVLVGFPLFGMLAGIFIGVKANSYAQSIRINDYGRQIAYTVYTVKPGDTVWGIAQDLAAFNPEFNDIRQYVSAIQKANDMESGSIEAGEVILIPYYISPNGILDYDTIYSKYGIGK